MPVITTIDDLKRLHLNAVCRGCSMTYAEIRAAGQERPFPAENHDDFEQSPARARVRVPPARQLTPQHPRRRNRAGCGDARGAGPPLGAETRPCRHRRRRSRRPGRPPKPLGRAPLYPWSNPQMLPTPLRSETWQKGPGPKTVCSPASIPCAQMKDYVAPGPGSSAPRMPNAPALCENHPA